MQFWVSKAKSVQVIARLSLQVASRIRIGLSQVRANPFRVTDFWKTCQVIFLALLVIVCTGCYSRNPEHLANLKSSFEFGDLRVSPYGYTEILVTVDSTDKAISSFLTDNSSARRIFINALPTNWVDVPAYLRLYENNWIETEIYSNITQWNYGLLAYFGSSRVRRNGFSYSDSTTLNLFVETYPGYLIGYRATVPKADAVLPGEPIMVQVELDLILVYQPPDDYITNFDIALEILFDANTVDTSKPQNRPEQIDMFMQGARGAFRRTEDRFIDALISLYGQENVRVLFRERLE